MANAFENNTTILPLFIRAMMNKSVLLKNVDRQVGEKDFAGDKNTGGTVYVKRPVRAKSTAGAKITEGQLTDIEQATVPVEVDTYRKVAFTLTQDQLALNDVEIMKFMEPFAGELVQDIENAIATAATTYFPNAIGTPGSTPASFLEVGKAYTRLFGLGVPTDDINAFYNPEASLYIADALKASPDQATAKTAIQQAFIKRVSNMNLYNCQSLTTHTVGLNVGTPLVKGADQDTTYALSKNSQTQNLITDGWTAAQTGIVTGGTNFTIDGVYEINANSRVANSNLQVFVATTTTDSDGSGDSTLVITPPIITSGPYQTVSAAPANNAAITVLGTASTAYAQNIAFQKNAITLAFARLPEMDVGGIRSRRLIHDGISMNYSTGGDISDISAIYRFDIRFGVKVQNPMFGIKTYGE